MPERNHRPTIVDVGRLANVSPGTVSKALRGLPGVSEETRRRVESAARSVGYQASRAARALPVGKTHLIGYRISADPANALMAALLNSMVRAASRNDYEMLLFAAKPGQSELDAYNDVLHRGGVDGFVLAYLHPEDRRIRFLEDEGVEYVAFGHLPRTARGSWVDSAGATGLASAVHHLAELGHRRIGFVGWPDHEWTTGDIRYRGYAEAIDRLDLPLDPSLVARVDGYAPADGRDGFLRLVEADPTAVVCVSDNLAFGVMHAAEELGLAVGTDLSVIGYDDIPAAADVRPSLTTLRQPIDALGSRLIDALLRRIERPGSDPEGIEIRPELVVRQSVGPVPSSITRR